MRGIHEGLYLKPLDDAFNAMEVPYFRYQDDILILCQTKSQFNRCKQRMMAVLKKRRLSLSSKKTRMGAIEKGFHFLGINYLGTQPSNNIKVTQADEKPAGFAQYLSSMGGQYCNWRYIVWACTHRSTCKNVA